MHLATESIQSLHGPVVRLLRRLTVTSGPMTTDLSQFCASHAWQIICMETAILAATPGDFPG
jgi:hypothetical protein